MSREHYHGYPLPDDTCRLVVHKKFPLHDTMNGVTIGGDGKEGIHPVVDRDTLLRLGPLLDQIEGAELINHWHNGRRQTDTVVFRTQAGKSFGLEQQNAIGSRAEKLLCTIGVSRNWDLPAELTAQVKLLSLLKEHQQRDYVLTGMFMERSHRSNVLYLFRKCRPTLAISMNDNAPRVLCALCMHPIGFYEGTFAGGMVPTDDVIAHVVLMRGDEHHYWKVCNQHSAWLPEAGL